MGNIITTSFNSWNRGSGMSVTAQNPSLWDMLTFLLKKYVISKVENDEFLCQYLLMNGSSGTIYNYGQRAITFEPLPSRICPEEYDIKYSNPKVVDCNSSSSDESEPLISSSCEEEEKKDEALNPSLAIYSAYGRMLSN